MEGLFRVSPAITFKMLDVCNSAVDCVGCGDVADAAVVGVLFVLLEFETSSKAEGVVDLCKLFCTPPIAVAKLVVNSLVGVVVGVLVVGVVAIGLCCVSLKCCWTALAAAK